VKEEMQKMLEYITKYCKKIDVLENARITVEIWDCEDMQCRVVPKKEGKVLLIPIVLCTPKDSLGKVVYD